MKRLLALVLVAASLVAAIGCRNGATHLSRAGKLFPRTLFLTEIPLSSTYSNGNPWLGWSGRWTDWPLQVDRALPYTEGLYNQASLPDFRRTVDDIAAYGALDGFTYNADRKHFYRYRENGLTNLPVRMVPNYQFVHGDGDEPFFAQAIASPDALRLNGKTVITSYYTARFKPAQLKAKLDFLHDKYGDGFLFVASVGGARATLQQPYFAKHGHYDEKNLEEVKEKFRAYLRVCDGICLEGHNGCCEFYGDERSIDLRCFEATCVRPLREVMDEPEFRGKKLLAFNVGPGHANHQTYGNRASANGTRTLRKMLETALAADPDYVVFFEWDEWNENTMIKPTLWTSFANRRVLRAERAAFEGRAAALIRGDDPAVPNLVLSFRKTITLGQLAAYEVLSVPDESTRGTYAVTLTLKDENGAVVKRFDTVTLDAARLEERRLEWASEDAGAAAALVPELIVTWNGRTLRYADGLPFCEIRPTATWDRKWQLVSLRDLITDGAACDLVRAAPEGECAARVAVSARLPQTIDRLEVMDGGELVYSMPGKPEEDFRDDAEHLVFSCWNTLGRYSKKDAKISIAGVTEAEWLIGTKRTKGLSRKVIAQSIYTPDTYLRVRRAEAAKGVVTLDWPEGGVVSIPLEKVLSSGAFALNGPTNGLVFAVRRYYKQPYFMSPVGRREAKAEVTVHPDLPVSVLGAHALTAEGKAFWSKPLVVGRRSGRMHPLRVWSNAKRRAVTVDVPVERIPEIAYDLSGERTGTIIGSGAGRAFDGMLGASTALATQRNRASASFLHVCLIDESSRALPCWSPRQVRTEDGRSALAFDGAGTYFTTPLACIPQNAAWRLSFEFKPEGSGAGMEVFSSGTRALWAHMAYLRVDKEGFLTGAYISQHDYRDTVVKSRGKVRANDWNRVELVHDVDSLELILNGESAGRVPSTVPGRYDSSSWFGGRPDALFKGLVRDIRISHR